MLFYIRLVRLCVSILIELRHRFLVCEKALSTHFWDALHFVKFSKVRITIPKWNQMCFPLHVFSIVAVAITFDAKVSEFQSGFWTLLACWIHSTVLNFQIMVFTVFDCCSTYKPVVNKLNVNSIKYVRYLVRTTHQISKRNSNHWRNVVRRVFVKMLSL